MPGITELNILLSKMSPQLRDQEFVFCCIENGLSSNILDLNPIGLFQEDEGLTIILSREKAEERQLSYEGIFRKITLQVHSSLDAVGLTAAVATALTKENISANVIAGYYHDHIFVQSDKAKRALSVLQQFAGQ